jgi:hypothetical protein
MNLSKRIYKRIYKRKQSQETTDFIHLNIVKRITSFNHLFVNDNIIGPNSIYSHLNKGVSTYFGFLRTTRGLATPKIILYSAN